MTDDEMTEHERLDLLVDTDPLQLRDEAWALLNEVLELRAEVDRLKGEVERCRTA